MYIINAKIYTMASDVIPNGWIQIEEGKISALGSMDKLPATEEELVDVHGAGVYPGFIDAHTHLGMCEDSLGFEGDDLNEETDPVTPQLRGIDAINPMDRCFTEALEAGVTTVVTGPGSANPISGQLAAIKTYGTCIDEMIVKAPVAMKMALGENPKSVYHGKSQAPTTRMATAALIREELFKAQRYMQDTEHAQSDEDIDPPEYDMKAEALIPALKGEIEVHFHAHRADDIYTAIRIAKEFQLNYVIVHGTEGYLIADGLKKEGTRVLAGPFLTDRSKPELHNLTPANAGILNAKGVPTAIVTDHPVIPLQYLPTCAGLAVREGMAAEEALKAITIYPAVICGIDSRVGSIEAGKDADLVVFDTDPLAMTSKPRLVIASGKIVAKR